MLCGRLCGWRSSAKHFDRFKINHRLSKKLSSSFTSYSIFCTRAFYFSIEVSPNFFPSHYSSIHNMLGCTHVIYCAVVWWYPFTWVIIADETTDVLENDQVSISLRHVSDNFNVRDDSIDKTVRCCNTNCHNCNKTWNPHFIDHPHTKRQRLWLHNIYLGLLE